MCCRGPLGLGNNVKEHYYYELISNWTSTSTPWPAGCLNYSDILRRTENWRDQNKQRSNLRANNDVILSFKSIFSTKYAGFVSLALIIQILASYTMFWSYPYPMPRSQSKYTEMEVTKIWRWGSMKQFTKPTNNWIVIVTQQPMPSLHCCGCHNGHLYFVPGSVCSAGT